MRRRRARTVWIMASVVFAVGALALIAPSSRLWAQKPGGGDPVEASSPQIPEIPPIAAPPMGRAGKRRFQLPTPKPRPWRSSSGHRRRPTRLSEPWARRPKLSAHGSRRSRRAWPAGSRSRRRSPTTVVGSMPVPYVPPGVRAAASGPASSVLSEWRPILSRRSSPPSSLVGQAHPGSTRPLLASQATSPILP
jgi:hypothetical protein